MLGIVALHPTYITDWRLGVENESIIRIGVLLVGATSGFCCIAEL